VRHVADPILSNGAIAAAWQKAIDAGVKDVALNTVEVESAVPSARRRPSLGGYFTGTGATSWVTAAEGVDVAYPLDSVAVLQRPAYLAIGGENLSPWSKRVTGQVARLMRFEDDQILPGDQLPPGDAGRLLVNAMSIAPELEAEFNEWDDKEHIPALSAVPGLLCARRFRDTSGNRKYVALYHLATPEVQESAAWKEARSATGRAACNRISVIISASSVAATCGVSSLRESPICLPSYAARRKSTVPPRR